MIYFIFTPNSLFMKYSFPFFLVFLYLLIYSQSTFGQNHSYTDKYNLDFTQSKNNKANWSFEPSLTFNLKIDSSLSFHGKYPMYFGQAILFKMPMRLKGMINQRLLLPENKADSASLSLTCKGKRLEYANFIISGFNDQEKMIYSDTLSLLGSEDWKTFNRTVSIKNIAFLHLKIDVLGSRPDLISKGNYKLPEQNLYLDKIEIKIDGKDINDFSLTEIPIFPDIKKSDIISLSLTDPNSFTKIPELGNSKIIAIGETIHGSETIAETAVQIIKNQVENNNCKLVLFEMPASMSLQINRFIQGDTLFRIETFKPDILRLLISPNAIFDLLNWLKQYNEKVKDKVLFMGMDVDLSSLETSKSLYDFVSKINENKKDNLLDSLCFKLYYVERFKEAIQLLEKNKELENTLTKNEIEILKYCLNESLDLKAKTINFYFTRDKEMFLNASFLINLLCKGEEKVTTYTHFLHANYKNSSPAFPFNISFGAYMKNKYGKDYYSLALLAGTGFVRAYDQDSIKAKRILEPSPENSLENSFMRTQNELFFIPVSLLPTQLTNIRTIGNPYKINQFDYISPAGRTDGMIFIRNSKEWDLQPNAILTVKESRLLLFKQISDRFKQYKAKYMKTKSIDYP